MLNATECRHNAKSRLINLVVRQEHAQDMKDLYSILQHALLGIIVAQLIGH